MPVTTLGNHAIFNTASLRKAVALSALNDYAEDVKVKKATYHGDTYPEGTITLNVKLGDALFRKWRHQKISG